MRRSLIGKYRTIIIVLVIAAAYVLLNYQFDLGTITQSISTISLLAGVVALAVQLKREQDLNEAQFITEYNDRFTTDPKMVNIEMKLEKFSKSPLTEIDFPDAERQDLINYLVYLEGLAALVSRDVLRIPIIDNLFAYRYFLAVNNPKVQELELNPDGEYYKGVFCIYEPWSTYRQKAGEPILLSETALSRSPEFSRYAATHRQHSGGACDGPIRRWRANRAR